MLEFVRNKVTLEAQAAHKEVKNITRNGKTLKVGGQAMQIGVGARYWAKSPEGGPDGWGARAVVTLLFPRA